MKISSILKTDKIIPNYEGSSKDEIINLLVDLFKGDERVGDLEKVRTAVLEREKIMSTGVGKGFAIPHGKTDGVNDMIAGFCKAKAPIEFEALDGAPVYLIFLLVGKENAVGPHIKMLSRISRMMNKDEFRKKLANAQTSEEIYEIFKEEEKNYIDLT